MREIVKLSILLALICAFCGALLMGVSSMTEQARRATNETKRLAAAQSVLPSFDEAEATILALSEPEGAFALVTRDGMVKGVAVEGISEKGYAGPIRLLVGFDEQENVIDFAVVEAHETPGLGAKIADKVFRKGFWGKSFATEWKVRKDGGEIDAVTSATISSRAACVALSDASAKVEAAFIAAKKNIEKEGEK